MSEKFVMRNRPSNEIRNKTTMTSTMKNFMDPTMAGQQTVKYYQVNLDEITPRPTNKFSQGRIDEMAASIRNTNNKVIHPIVLVKASDLPEGNRLREELEAQGIDLSSIKYVISAGERRFRAFKKLRDEENKNNHDDLFVNPFNTITARILTEKEALNEEAYYKDSNNLARHLTPAEGVWFIKDALKEVATAEQKRAFLVKQNGESEEGIDEDPDKAARKFRIADFCRARIEEEMGINDWSDSTLSNMATVAINCDDRIADALLAAELPIREAKNLAALSKEDQIRLLELFKEDREKYLAGYAAIREAGKSKKQKVTHADARRQLKASLKRIKEERTTLSDIAQGIGSKYNRNELDAIKKYDDFIAALEVLIENTK